MGCSDKRRPEQTFLKYQLLMYDDIPHRSQ